eukprot:TRINITY_DN100395_c0_g1_i1.p1 TRINITY_DN100395_c0_g1~~TRINITY_DN100395_c0_g1_i1.p1  ORF type:complete len:418 (+),score=160.34 TRINITY_DN100395_c0_g1_i1:86-1339(+)
MSGMAGKVRRVTESDEFDLAGYDQARCDELAKAAFTEDLPLNNMIRISFVVGGGKLVRQKYTDDLPKLFMGSMSSVGYVDDNSADISSGKASGGKYKYQHDTNKNLKFVHVFPKISGAAQASAAADGGEEEEEEEKPMSKEDLLFHATDDEFDRMMTAHLITYSQKKKLLELLMTRISNLEKIEAKMTSLQQLTPEEQAMYDDIGADELSAKVKHVKTTLQAMVDGGKLTSREKAAFEEGLDEKLEGVEAELTKANVEGKAKKIEALEKAKKQLCEARKNIKDAGSASLPPLRHGAEIGKLHRKLMELHKLEKDKKGNYSMDELKRLGDKADIEEALTELENRSRGWFEEDAIFQERLQACKKAAGPAKSSSSAKSSGGGGRLAPTGGYTTVSGGARQAKAKASGPNTRNAFSAFAD